MNSHRKGRLPVLRMLATCAVLMLAGCVDDNPAAPTTTTPPPTTSTPAASSGRLRVAQLTLDARTVDVAIDGEIVARGIAYPGVARYVELSEGTHRVQVFPVGKTGAALVETSVFVGGGQWLTVAVVGNDPVDLVTIADDTGGQPGEARVRFYNAVRDFPARFDLAVVNGPLVVGGIDYLEASGYTEQVPGIYNWVLRRGGTREQLATATGVLPSATATTVFAVGTLGRDDIALLIAHDEL